jgi:two-component system NtrC family sensor kinase
VIAAYTYIDPGIQTKERILWGVIIYFTFNILFGLLHPKTLSLRRVRIIPAVADIIFISFVVYSSTGPESSLFLFYLFPIISVSRYFGLKGALFLASCSIVAYLSLYIASAPNQDIDAYTFVLRCMVLVGVAVAAGSLAGAKQTELIKLTKILKEIDNAILSDVEIKQVLTLILKRGLEFTSSEMGHIRLFDSETQEYKIMTVIGHPKGYDWGTMPFDESFSQLAIQSRAPLIVPQIKKRELGRYLGTYFKLYRPRPKSALFVPLILKGNVIGVIAVYSRRRFHYTKMETEKLETFTSLVDMAIKAAASRDRDAEREKKLIETRRYYRNLILSSPDPIIALDKEGRIIVFNQACEKLWGFSYDEVKGQPVENYYASKEHAREIGKKLWESEGHRVKDFEAMIKDSQGELIPINLSACFLTENEERVGSIGVFKDLRELKQLQIQMLQAERLATVGRLARTAGHEIKHKIATALNYTEALLYKCDEEEDPRLFKIYSNIRAALWESVDKLQNLLTANKPKPPQKKRMKVEDIFYKVEEEMRQQANDRHIQFSVNYPEKRCELSVDIEQVEQVLSNLFTNSVYAIEARRGVDASFSGGRIAVSAIINSDSAQLLWQDDGCGISKDDLPNIFNAFFTKQGADIGTGLGLYIVKTIVEVHNGKITVDSELGRGACFRITLPTMKIDHLESESHPEQ